LKFGGWIILSIYILDTALRKLKSKKKKKKSLKLLQNIKQASPSSLRYICLRGRKRLKTWRVKRFIWRKTFVRLRTFLRNKQ
jgi:hypothetical protein